MAAYEPEPEPATASTNSTSTTTRHKAAQRAMVDDGPRQAVWKSALLLLLLLVFATLIIKLQRQGYLVLARDPKWVLTAYFEPDHHVYYRRINGPTYYYYYYYDYGLPGCGIPPTPHPLMITSQAILTLGDFRLERHGCWP